MSVITVKQKENTKNMEGVRMSSSKPVPKRLKKYRMDAGFTIYSLADKLNVNYSTVSYWENGVKHPRHNKIVELEDLFNVSYRELFSDLTEEEAAELERRIEEQRKNQGNE
ncbi:helix-turn-helix domain-containing protein [Collinsella aerofaciens]|uniref:helix-turn-helix domain-containing protein n=1 Tax=Collinsella aerofaciens TaxID=74426 RepID=UPI001D0268BB|nr:helix-turn-helix transcriptional regulator [Collinsella aerofaciens]MCB5366973.1 helix-turn-helix domain-containing protein [Collinsella aerofaciens]MCB5369023.1 helix-turn-helix domain-containing protein [Collinsella aerofaciens]